jgi:hypothetical protein
VEIEKYPRDGLQELVPHADVVFYSKTWAVVRIYPKQKKKKKKKVKSNLNHGGRGMDTKTLDRASRPKQDSPQKRKSMLEFPAPSVDHSS